MTLTPDGETHLKRFAERYGFDPKVVVDPVAALDCVAYDIDRVLLPPVRGERELRLRTHYTYRSGVSDPTERRKRIDAVLELCNVLRVAYLSNRREEIFTSLLGYASVANLPLTAADLG